MSKKVCEICTKPLPRGNNTWCCASCFLNGRVETESNEDGTASLVKPQQKEAQP